MTKAHVHAENMRLYAEDAAKTDKPWELWESRAAGNEHREFGDLAANPAWVDNFEYRRKPRMITVGNHSWPEPMKEAPEIGTEYWMVFIWGMEPVDNDVWDGGREGYLSLKRGILHATKEAAQAHAEALIAISKGDI